MRALCKTIEHCNLNGPNNRAIFFLVRSIALHDLAIEASANANTKYLQCSIIIMIITCLLTCTIYWIHHQTKLYSKNYPFWICRFLAPLLSSNSSRYFYTNPTKTTTTTFIYSISRQSFCFCNYHYHYQRVFNGTLLWIA